MGSKAYIAIGLPPKKSVDLDNANLTLYFSLKQVKGQLSSQRNYGSSLVGKSNTKSLA